MWRGLIPRKTKVSKIDTIRKKNLAGPIKIEDIESITKSISIMRCSDKVISSENFIKYLKKK